MKDKVVKEIPQAVEFFRLVNMRYETPLAVSRTKLHVNFIDLVLHELSPIGLEITPLFAP